MITWLQCRGHTYMNVKQRGAGEQTFPVSKPAVYLKIIRQRFWSQTYFHNPRLSTAFSHLSAHMKGHEGTPPVHTGAAPLQAFTCTTCSRSEARRAVSDLRQAGLYQASRIWNAGWVGNVTTNGFSEFNWVKLKVCKVHQSHKVHFVSSVRWDFIVYVSDELYE